MLPAGKQFGLNRKRTICFLSSPRSQFSSSLPSMQSTSASQRHRMVMQWPFLHWNWWLSHFTSQPIWMKKPSLVLDPLSVAYTHTYKYQHFVTCKICPSNQILKSFIEPKSIFDHVLRPIYWARAECVRILNLLPLKCFLTLGRLTALADYFT